MKKIIFLCALIFAFTNIYAQDNENEPDKTSLNIIDISYIDSICINPKYKKGFMLHTISKLRKEIRIIKFDINKRKQDLILLPEDIFILEFIKAQENTLAIKEKRLYFCSKIKGMYQKQ